MSKTGWDLPDPYIHRIGVTEDAMDAFGHANNARYLEWADEAAWTHWWAKGYSMDACQTEDRGIAIIRTEADYLGHVRVGDALGRHLERHPRESVDELGQRRLDLLQQLVDTFDAPVRSDKTVLDRRCSKLLHERVVHRAITLSPFEHGEVFVTDDGGETDLDLGHYERFIDENLTTDSNGTTGSIYSAVIAACAACAKSSYLQCHT